MSGITSYELLRDRMWRLAMGAEHDDDITVSVLVRALEDVNKEVMR